MKEKSHKARSRTTKRQPTRKAFNRSWGEKWSPDPDFEDTSWQDKPKKRDFNKGGKPFHGKVQFKKDRFDKGDRPFKKRSDFQGDRGPRDFSQKRSFGDKPFGRSRDDRGPRSFDRKPFNRSRDDRGPRNFDRKPFDRSRDDRGPRNFDRKPFGRSRDERDGKRDFSNRRSFDKKPFNRSRDDKWGQDRPFREKRPSFPEGGPKFSRNPNRDVKPIDSDSAYFYGIPSCLQILKKRPRSVQKVFVRKDLEELIPKGFDYKVVGDSDLERLTDSRHHEGICVLADKKLPTPFSEALIELKEARCIVYLDEVGNPHNLGAIVRTAAHFGISHVLTPSDRPLPPSSYRIARDGAEHVELVTVQSPLEDLKTLQKMGFNLVGTTPADGIPLGEMEKGVQSVIVLGSETEGVSSDVLEIADHTISIPGSGQVESLNVSNAFCILAYELFK